MRKIDVCFSPDLIHLYDLTDKCVVVVDIFRATSCMVTAFAHGAAEIVPVEQIELCQSFRRLMGLFTRWDHGDEGSGEYEYFDEFFR